MWWWGSVKIREHKLVHQVNISNIFPVELHQRNINEVRTTSVERQVRGWFIRGGIYIRAPEKLKNTFWSQSVSQISACCTRTNDLITFRLNFVSPDTNGLSLHPHSPHHWTLGQYTFDPFVCNQYRNFKFLLVLLVRFGLWGHGRDQPLSLKPVSVSRDPLLIPKNQSD